jgi:hypothetical protein
VLRVGCICEDFCLVLVQQLIAGQQHRRLQHGHDTGKTFWGM